MRRTNSEYLGRSPTYQAPGGVGSSALVMGRMIRKVVRNKRRNHGHPWQRLGDEEDNQNFCHPDQQKNQRHPYCPLRFLAVYPHESLPCLRPTLVSMTGNPKFVHDRSIKLKSRPQTGLCTPQNGLGDTDYCRNQAITRFDR
jgi:hypothetical protein